MAKSKIETCGLLSFAGEAGRLQSVYNNEKDNSKEMTGNHKYILLYRLRYRITDGYEICVNSTKYWRRLQ